MKFQFFISILLLSIGIGLIIYASSIPVYTDPDAPGRLSYELRELPRDQKFHQWYTQLASYETLHKRYFDIGMGITALGGGLFFVFIGYKFYQKNNRLQNLVFVVISWITAWAIQIPGAFLYYGIRQDRFDYPTWGDSIAIPIFEEFFVSILGCIVTLIVLLLFAYKRTMPSRIKFVKPQNLLGWSRFLILLAWLCLLIFIIITETFDGNPGSIISCLISCWLLLLIMSANQKNKVAEQTY